MTFNGTHQFIASAYAEAIIDTTKQVALEVNAKKTKRMLMSAECRA
jgi:hypothetical protein